MMAGGALAGGLKADVRLLERKSSPRKVGLIVGLSVTLEGGESAVEPRLSRTRDMALKLRALGLCMVWA